MRLENCLPCGLFKSLVMCELAEYFVVCHHRQCQRTKSILANQHFIKLFKPAAKELKLKFCTPVLPTFKSNFWPNHSKVLHLNKPQPQQAPRYG